MGELGSLLSRQREARGLTIDDAERDTRISRRYLQALEAEQFDVIPAPVYARGFLRSYSQYLGLDPQEMLAMFPREGQPEPEQAEVIGAGSRQARPSTKQPPSAVGPPSPVTRRPTPPAPSLNGKRRAPLTPREEPLAYPLEPTIGIDIGVPNPARKIKTDPAAQTRSMTLVVVAVAVIVGAVLLAFLILQLGGDGSGTQNSGAPTTRAGSSATSGARGPFAPNVTQGPIDGGAATPAPSDSKGVVPDVTKLSLTAARKRLTDLGYTVSEKHQKSSSVDKDAVIEQAPAPNVSLEAGKTVIIVISDGP